MTTLHEVESEEETTFVGVGRGDGDEDDGPDDVDDDVADHAENGLASLGTEPPEESLVNRCFMLECGSVTIWLTR